MSVNIIGANASLQASATGVSIASFASSQYNPVPWPATLWALGQALPGPTVTNPRTTLDLSVAGNQKAQSLPLPTSQWSPMFSQFLRIDLQAGETWQILLSNLENEVIPVRLAIYLYHPGADGSSEMMPTFLV